MTEFQNQFDPEVVISPQEQAALVLLSASEGFKVLNRIMRGEVDKLIMSFVNEPGDSDAMVLNKHKLVKAAALFYDGVVNRMNHEISVYASQQVDTTPVDVTEHLIDLGAPASTYGDLEQEKFDGIEESPFN